MSETILRDGTPHVVVIPSGPVGGKGDPGSPGEGYATRAALAAVSATHLDDAYLTEEGREGKFVFNAGNLSAEVAADTAQDIYVAPSSDTSGASGAWVRTLDSNILRLRNPVAALDIWKPRTASGTYSTYIGQIDSELSGEISSGKVTKTNRGNASDGSTPVYSYTGGSGPVTVLLIGGMHGLETPSAIAMFEWFLRFVKSNNPTITLLRNAYRVIFVPALNASRWNTTKNNANNVNLNRNFPFFWARNTEADKGSAALSEPEAQIVKTLLDNEDVAVFIDAHNMSPNESPVDIEIYPPSAWVLGNRSIHRAAMSRAAEAYGLTWRVFGVPFDAIPVGVSWANHYLRNVKNRPHAVAALFESNVNFAGSTALSVTATAMTKFCGSVNTFLLTYLDQGFAPPVAYSFAQYAQRIGSADTTSVSAGGTLVDSGTKAAITFDFITPGSPGSLSRNYIEQVAPCPGAFLIEFGAYFEGSVSSEHQLQLFLHINGVEHAVLVGSVRSATDREGMSRVHRFGAGTPDAATIHKFELMAARVPSNVKIKRAWISLIFTPNTDMQPVPMVNVA